MTIYRMSYGPPVYKQSKAGIAKGYQIYKA